MRPAVRTLACVFAVLALVTAVGGVCFIFANRNAQPVLVTPSQGALDTAQRLMDAVSAGDYATAGSLMLGCPDMGVDRNADSPVGRLVWKAYQDSVTFAPVGECFATEQGIGQRYTVRYLDMAAVTANLRVYSEALLELRVQQAKDVSEVYNANNEYREDVVMDVLCDAAEKALKRDAAFVETTFTVNLVYRDGKWLAIPDGELMKAITGGLAG